MKKALDILVKNALEALGAKDVRFAIEYPEDSTRGDYATNAALAAAKILKGNPRDIAEKLKEEILRQEPEAISKVEIAGPGFLNFFLTKEYVAKGIFAIDKKFGKNSSLAGKKVIVEYTQPNPFKPFHIGHLMSNAIGESISRIVEFSGAETVRANYQGDVGPHIAKALYVLLDAPIPGELEGVSAQAKYIGECYVKGNTLYESDETHKAAIDMLNREIYERTNPRANEMYDLGRRITLEAFEIIYTKLGTRFDHYFFESEMAPIGVALVNEFVGLGVFEKSEGAIVFRGEQFNSKLHTRPFISSKGLPLYEAKELGLNITKFKKENPDISIITTAVEQAEYMKVVTEAIRQIDVKKGTNYADRMKHIAHGMMRLTTGKMSSRKGSVITGESMIEDAQELVREKIKDRGYSSEEAKEIEETVGVGAIKYSVLRSAPGSDIVYDPEKSVSFEGDSGPYLQYATVRARSVLEKAGPVSVAAIAHTKLPDEVGELERFALRFPEIVEHSLAEYAPHFIAGYLISLAGAFNAYYANNPILESGEDAPYRLALTRAFVNIMENGLWLLGVRLPKRM